LAVDFYVFGLVAYDVESYASDRFATFGGNGIGKCDNIGAFVFENK
jgi:hypothetical protein